MMIVEDLGSSPLARGLRISASGHWNNCGIIPARAGFTYPCHTDIHTPQDHPRSRGVYNRIPPHPREFPRIIPARAGFTHAHRRIHLPRTDHPRSRGVYVRPEHWLRAVRGSSPLARGLRRSRRRSRSDIRIIPARAGFTLPDGRRRPLGEDHPRSRGVYPSA